MQNIQIKVDVDKWNDACRYLKDPAAKLDVAEESAVEQLSDFWRTRPFSQELSDDCSELLDVLYKNLKLYSANNKKTKEWLQTYRGLAKKIYCTDKETYEKYVAVLRETHNIRKAPTPKSPSQNPKKPVAPSQPVKSELKIISVDFADSNDPNKKFSLTVPTTVHYLIPRIKYTITPAPKSPISVRYRLISPDGEMKKNDEYPDGFLDTKSLTSREGTLEFDGWGNNTGTSYKEGRWRFELYSDAKLINTTYFEIKSPFSHSLPSIDIQKVEFANTDYDGGILNDYGTKLPQNTRYLQPRIHYTVRNVENRDIEIRYAIYDPNGRRLNNSSRSDIYASSTKINLSWDSPSTLNGFGNREGNCYISGRYRVDIYENDYLLYKTYVNIGNSVSPTYTPPPQNNQTPSSGNSGTQNNGKGILGCFIWLIIAGAVAFGLFKWCGGDENNKTESDNERYVVAEKVFLRSTPNSNKNSNVITIIPYGTQLSYIGESDGWIEVKDNKSGKKGYVAANYVMGTSDFNHLDSIWGSRDILNDITLTRYRQALVYLYNELKQQTGNNYFVLDGPSENWMEKNIQDDANDFPEFAFIVKDIETGKRMTAVFSFLANENPILRHLEEAPDTGGITNISYKTGSGYSISYGSRKKQSKKSTKKKTTPTPKEISEPVVTEEISSADI